MAFIRNACMPVSLKGNIIILEQLKRCICKIQVKGTSGTGFFCFIPYNNKSLPVLVTDNHIVNSEIDEITILMDDSMKRIQINEARKTYFNRELNITIIEIIPEKDLMI